MITGTLSVPWSWSVRFRARAVLGNVFSSSTRSDQPYLCLVNLGVRPSATLASLLYYSCSGQWCEALLADNIIKMINNPVWRQASVSDEESGASSLLEPGPVRRTRQRECDRVTVPGLGRR